MRPNAGRSRRRNPHGFADADDDHMFLDPVKVTILTPGMDEQGNMSEEGYPPRWWRSSSMSEAWWWKNRAV